MSVSEENRSQNDRPHEEQHEELEFVLEPPPNLQVDNENLSTEHELDVPVHPLGGEAPVQNPARYETARRGVA